MPHSEFRPRGQPFLAEPARPAQQPHAPGYTPGGLAVGIADPAYSRSPARWSGRRRPAARLLQFVQQRQVPLEQIITHRFALTEAPAAFRLADSATTGKILFTWD